MAPNKIAYASEPVKTPTIRNRVVEVAVLAEASGYWASLQTRFDSWSL